MYPISDRKKYLRLRRFLILKFINKPVEDAKERGANIDTPKVKYGIIGRENLLVSGLIIWYHISYITIYTSNYFVYFVQKNYIRGESKWLY